MGPAGGAGGLARGRSCRRAGGLYRAGREAGLSANVTQPTDAPLRCPICHRGLPGKPFARSCFAPDQGGAAKGGSRTSLRRCPACGLIFRDYDYAAAPTASFFDRSVEVVPENEELVLRAKRGLVRGLVRRYGVLFGERPRPRMVDYGCSYGHLGLAFREAGWDVAGVDIAPRVLEYHRRHGTFPVYDTLDAPEITDGSVDLIAMIDVLYYVEDPVGVLQVAYRKLARPGTVRVRLANRVKYLRAAAFLDGILGTRLFAKMDWAHKTFLSPGTLRVAARQAGFEEVCVIRRERGYRYPWPRAGFHWLTQNVSRATGASSTRPRCSTRNCGSQGPRPQEVFGEDRPAAGRF